MLTFTKVVALYDPGARKQKKAVRTILLLEVEPPNYALPLWFTKGPRGEIVGLYFCTLQNQIMHAKPKHSYKSSILNG